MFSDISIRISSNSSYERSHFIFSESEYPAIDFVKILCINPIMSNATLSSEPQFSVSAWKIPASPRSLPDSSALPSLKGKQWSNRERESHTTIIYGIVRNFKFNIIRERKQE